MLPGSAEPALHTLTRTVVGDALRACTRTRRRSFVANTRRERSVRAAWSPCAAPAPGPHRRCPTTARPAYRRGAHSARQEGDVHAARRGRANPSVAAQVDVLRRDAVEVRVPALTGGRAERRFVPSTEKSPTGPTVVHGPPISAVPSPVDRGPGERVGGEVAVELGHLGGCEAERAHAVRDGRRGARVGRRLAAPAGSSRRTPSSSATPSRAPATPG